MRALTPALLTSFAGRAGPGRAVKITRRDGEVLRLIEAMTTMTIGAQTWVPGTGLIVGSLPFAASEEATSLDLDVVATTGGVIDIADVHAGIYRGATVQLYMINRLTPADGLGLLFEGTIGQVTAKGLGRVTMEAIGPLGRMAQLWAHKWSPTCRWLFGDSKCGIDIDALSDAATVSAVSGGFALTLTGASGADDHWNNGHIHVDSGLMEGFDFEIRDWAAAGTLTLFLPVAELIGAGANVTLFPGCTYQIAEAGGCAVRWSNGINFGGEPYMPGALSLPATGVAAPSGVGWSTQWKSGGLEGDSPSGGMILSNGNLTARTPIYTGGGTGYYIIRSAKGHSTGKRLIGFDPTAANALSTRVGLCAATYAVDTIDQNLDNVALQSSGSAVWWGGMYFNVGSADHMEPLPTYSSATTELLIAVDLDANLIWFQKDGGGWYGGGDPAAGTGGMDLNLGSGVIYASFSGTGNGIDECTFNPTGPFAGGTPTGFLPWDA